MAQDRLQWTDGGQLRLALRRPWSDGTTHLLFDPVELLARLAALTPRPRINLILYHGVLAPRAAWRSLVVQFACGPDAAATPEDAADTPMPAVDRPSGNNRLWADLMRRSLGLDVLARPRCSGRLRLIALIDDPAVIARILTHVQMSPAIPAARRPRAPPWHLARDAPVRDRTVIDNPA